MYPTIILVCTFRLHVFEPQKWGTLNYLILKWFYKARNVILFDNRFNIINQAAYKPTRNLYYCNLYRMPLSDNGTVYVVNIKNTVSA